MAASLPAPSHRYNDPDGQARFPFHTGVGSETPDRRSHVCGAGQIRISAEVVDQASAKLRL